MIENSLGFESCDQCVTRFIYPREGRDLDARLQDFITNLKEHTKSAHGGVCYGCAVRLRQIRDGETDDVVTIELHWGAFHADWAIPPDRSVHDIIRAAVFPSAVDARLTRTMQVQNTYRSTFDDSLSIDRKQWIESREKEYAAHGGCFGCAGHLSLARSGSDLSRRIAEHWKAAHPGEIAPTSHELREWLKRNGTSTP